MSSQSKRRAESEEVAHKKKPRQGGDEDEFSHDKNDGLEDELGALDEDNIILADRRTRGKRVDYTEGGLAGDNGSKSGEEIPKEKKGAPAAPRTISPERKPVNIQEEDEEEEEEEEYEGDGGDEDEDGTDSYDEDEDE